MRYIGDVNVTEQLSESSQALGPDGPRREAHCVLWHAPDRAPSAELLAVLDRRGLTVRRHTERTLALAEVCAYRLTPGAAASPSILVFVEPERLLRPDEMKQVLERYAPATACWVYRESGTPQLRALEEQDLARWRARRALPEPRVAASIKSSSVWAEAKIARHAPSPMPPMAPVIVGPRLKLTGAGAVPVLTPSSSPRGDDTGMPGPAQPEDGAMAAVAEGKPATDIRHLLSEDEVAMLLSAEADNP